MNSKQKFNLAILIMIVLAILAYFLGFLVFDYGFANENSSSGKKVDIVFAAGTIVVAILFIGYYAKRLKANKPIFSNTKLAENALFYTVVAAAIILLFLWLTGRLSTS
jgi:hypothetical protein